MRNNRGMRGDNCGFFCRLWNGIKDNFLGILGGTLAGGPIGGLVTVFTIVADSITNERSMVYHVSPANEPRLDAWSRDSFLPFVNQILATIAEQSPSTYLSANYIGRFNAAIRQLTILKAYYEYRATKATSALDTEMFAAMATAVGSFMAEIQKWYLGVVADTGNPTSYGSRNLEATDFTRIGFETLDWGSARTVVASVPYLPGGSTGTATGSFTATPKGGFAATASGYGPDTGRAEETLTTGGRPYVDDDGTLTYPNDGQMVLSPPLVPTITTDPVKVDPVQTSLPPAGGGNDLPVTTTSRPSGASDTGRPKRKTWPWLAAAAVVGAVLYKSN